MTLAFVLVAAVALAALLLLGVALALITRELDRQRAERQTFIDAFMARDARELAGLRKASRAKPPTDDEEERAMPVPLIGMGG